MLMRQGSRGRLHFLDGTPTDTVFDLGRDEYSVLEWIGLPLLRDGDQQWLDLAAHVVEPTSPFRPDATWTPAWKTETI
jgi:hypothetical protein